MNNGRLSSLFELWKQQFKYINNKLNYNLLESIVERDRHKVIGSFCMREFRYHSDGGALKFD